MLISFPRRPARNFSIISANSGWSCSWIRGTRAMGILLFHKGRGPREYAALGCLGRVSLPPLEAGRLHDRRPARKLLADELPRRVGVRVEDRLEAGRHQDALNVRIRHDLARGLGDAVDDRLGHAGGSEEPVEIAGDHARPPPLDRGWNVRRPLDPPFRVEPP